MTQVRFRIHYVTQWGENLLLEHAEAHVGRAPKPMHLPLAHAGDGYWVGTFQLAPPGGRFAYRYVFRGPSGEERREPVFRQLAVQGATLDVEDEWFPAEWPEAALFRQAFPGIIFQPHRASSPTPDGRAPRLRLTLRAPRVPRGHRVAVGGAHPLLGQWDPARVLRMSGVHYPLWTIDLPRAELPDSLEFKFGLWDDTAGMLAAWEEGPSRVIRNPPSAAEVRVVNAEHYRHPTVWKGAGVAVPVFALRTAQGYGIGEFADLAPFAAWAADCGMHLVQLLPVNDTSTDGSWKDSYPYKAISTAALHPVYLNIDAACATCHQPLPRQYNRRRTALNALPQVDYVAVLRDKLAYLRDLYRAAAPGVCRSAAFTAFLAETADWLPPYAAFCTLRDRFGTADFSQWGPHAVYSAATTRAWFQPEAPEHAAVRFHCFVQFLLRQQLDQALAAGHARGVAFKGDLPIGIDRHSVEAWTEPALFHMDRQTGAPPDPFSAVGQNWGFPTYDWPRMERDGYAWWRGRLGRMASCFDALRIDHILGFFRIWEIPGHCREGLLGHFNPALPLSPEEIRASGFRRDVTRFAQPAVTPADLPNVLGPAAARAIKALLTLNDDGFLRFRPEWLPPAAQATWLSQRRSPAERERLATALERFSYEVLFLEDPEQPGRFHPRIALADSRLCQSLPPEEQAALRALHDDFFYRRHTRFWEHEAMKKLPALMDATAMLLCGEDLGMIPDAVPVVLKRLGLLSLEVQSMPKQLGQRFGDPEQYPYLSVCTTSTHDTPTLRGWWAEDQAGRQAFYRDLMKGSGDVPPDCTPDICQFILTQNLASQSMWCILPLQDWLSLDAQLRHPDPAAERINVPANPRHYWRYRMHLTLEQLQQARALHRVLTRLIQQAGRAG